MQGKLFRCSAFLDRRLKKVLGGGTIALCAQEKVDRLPCVVDSARQVTPLAFHFQLRRIDSPGGPDWAGVALPMLLKPWDIALHPS